MITALKVQGTINSLIILALCTIKQTTLSLRHSKWLYTRNDNRLNLRIH